MLEIKNLVKIYSAKGGTEVRAVDDVSLSFTEKGMVFLPGKPGSGKSTLLNLCGGLDSPDSGEIIIKGRSSKDFSQADFDSYRNTFVGFVFQEYNILNEFSVEDNVSLALELQGKSKDKTVISEILKSVDLQDFSKRKPNTLSGGQKRRVAIARALVKNPEIILADEHNVNADNDTFFTIISPISDSLANINVIIEIMEKVFLWSGIVMAIFAMLLLFNFISVSIADKKKEIGILRAVGARSVDIFKIFYSESLLIATICFVISTAACFAICPWLNAQLASAMGLEILVVGPYSVLIMLGIALLTSIVATFLPVYSIARKKPVESIRAL